MRHAAEFRKLYLEDETPSSYVFQYTDGGSDHNNNHIQVQLSYIALVLNLGLAGLLCARTPPYLSVINPAERVMATLNLGLYGVSLCQSGLTSEEEKLIKNLGSKCKWREAQATENNKDGGQKIDYKKLALKASMDARTLVAERFSELTYGDNQIQVYETIDNETIDILYDELNRIDPNFNWKKPNLTKNEVMKNERMRKFYENHIVELHYSFQFRNCEDENCEYCFQVEDKGVHEKFNWLPAPIVAPSDVNKYVSFEEALTEGKPSDTCRPGSLNSKNDYKLPKMTFPMDVNRARMAIQCAECQKFRLLFSKNKLSKDDREELFERLEDEQYLCGSPLFDETHHLYQKIFQAQNNTCSKPMSAIYYSAERKGIMGCKPLCSGCFTILNKNEQYAIEKPDYGGLPRCTTCQQEGKVVQHRLKKTKNKK